MVLSNVCPSRMAPPCKNPMKTHMQRRSWLTDRHHTHCPDPVTWARSRQDVTKWSINEAQLPRQQRRSGNRITQTRGRNTKRHRNAKKLYFLVCQSTHHHFREPGTTVGTCCSPVLQPTLTRTTNGNTSWALPKMLTKNHMSVGAKHFVKTHGVPTPANTNCRRRVRRRKKRTTLKVSPSNGVRTQNKTHKAHDTATNKPTLPRLTVCHVAVLYETSHTDLVCPMMMFPNDMTNNYSTHKS